MEKNNGKAIASLVLGIVAVVLGFFGYVAIAGVACGIIGIILGVQAKKEIPEGAPTGMAVAGLVLSIIGTVLSGILLIACVACIGFFTTAASSLSY